MVWYPINVAGIMEDQNGNVWFASSENGVFRYDGKTIINIAEKEGLGDNYAGGMAQDKAGNMWFTMKNGICKYDKGLGSINKRRRQNRIPPRLVFPAPPLAALGIVSSYLQIWPQPSKI